MSRRVKDTVKIEDSVRLTTRCADGSVVQQVASGPPVKDPVTISGHVTLRTRDKKGRIVQEVEGDNIWTLTGREYIAELMTLLALNPARAAVRSDRILYIGLGSGTTTEVAEVSGLNDPVEYRVGEFLAQVQVPATFPADVDGSPRTAVRYIREFASNEISLGAAIVITELGLFTDGDPANDYSVPAPTDFTTASTRAPMAYKTVEPVTKDPDYTLEVIWEVRIR